MSMNGRSRDLSQGLVLMTLLPAPLLAEPFPQALHPSSPVQASNSKRLFWDRMSAWGNKRVFGYPGDGSTATPRLLMLIAQ